MTSRVIVPCMNRDEYNLGFIILFGRCFFLSFFLPYVSLSFFPGTLSVTHLFIRVINFRVLISHLAIKQYSQIFFILVQFWRSRNVGELRPVGPLKSEWKYMASCGPGVDSASNRNKY